METKKQHVCPWWLGYLLIVPLRKLYHGPEKLLSPYIRPGMKVMDFGCAMGYFSLPMAKLVGDEGKVYCLDIQPDMIRKLIKRADKARIRNRIEPRLINDIGKFTELENTIDMALLFAVVHEVPDKKSLFNWLAGVVKTQGKVLFAEPRGHVSGTDFENSVILAQEAGFHSTEIAPVRGSHAILLIRN